MKPKETKQDPENTNSTHADTTTLSLAPIFEVLHDEMTRVKLVLEERSKIETIITKLARRTSTHTILSICKRLHPSTLGITIPDVPLRTNSTSFTLSMWLKLDSSLMNSKMNSNVNSKRNNEKKRNGWNS